MRKLVICALLGLAVLQFLSARSQRQNSALGYYRVGIAKTDQDDTAAACEKGVIDALTARGIQAVYERRSVTADTAYQTAEDFKFKEVDIAVGIGPDAAAALADTLRVTPVVFSAVPDLAKTALVTRARLNITGVSNDIPVGDHIALFKDIASIKTVGYAYIGNDLDSLAGLELIKQACRKHGVALVTQAVVFSEDLPEAARALAARVDGFYLSAGIGGLAAVPDLIRVFRYAGKPVFSADVTAAFNGGCVIAAGMSYYKAGRAAGDMAADILLSKRLGGDIPVRFLNGLKDFDLLFDLDAARNCGFSIPGQYIPFADYLYLNGKLHRK